MVAAATAMSRLENMMSMSSMLVGVVDKALSAKWLRWRLDGYSHSHCLTCPPLDRFKPGVAVKKRVGDSDTTPAPPESEDQCRT